MPLTERRDPDVTDRRIAAILFFLTCSSVTAVHFWQWQAPLGVAGAARSVQFALALMGILLAHELGHLLVASRHRMVLAMPWFLPAPVWFGTFGAVIRRGDTPPTRTALVEMAAAGPLAGMVVVCLFTVLSVVNGSDAVPVAPSVLGRPLLWWAVASVLSGGAPPPITADDPLGFAAGIGAWVTAMNLIPIGQLDGGHIVSALFPGHARSVSRVATVVLLLAGFVWSGWVVWAVVANLVAGGSVTPRSAAPPSARGWRVAALAALAFVLCASPVPVPLASVALTSPTP